ncbi:TetR/AcrR family transcriptional regulator [[Actinomadura] parvosata]|uniref:TetR/AcrR family transcriptional regulator n=1 Tax=[Actinomadura] parvosata TaxID=1955412 RepID=UPI00406C81D3
MARRTQAERSDETTAALVRAARELFGAGGYATTSIDTIAAAAGVTKGAAYHHFGGKVELFRAVFVREQEVVAAKLQQAASEESDPWAALARGARAFLESCLDPGFRQIVLLDAPSLLGWEAVREIEYDHTLRVLLAGLRIASGEHPGDEVSARAQLVFGALCEAGMILACSADPSADLPRLAAEVDRFLESLKA